MRLDVDFYKDEVEPDLDRAFTLKVVNKKDFKEIEETLRPVTMRWCGITFLPACFHLDLNTRSPNFLLDCNFTVVP